MNRFSIWILLCLGGLIKEVELESQYVMPMSMGLKLSLPYDIANLFIRPTAGAISVLISVALLFIIFFGIITSPFGYFFGIPSRKYVLSGSPSERIEASPRFLEAEGILHKIQQLELFPLNSTSFFYWMGTENIEQDCQLMALCYAHGAFTSLPTKLLKIYSIFSRELRGLPPKYRKAIVNGLGSTLSCSRTYNACPHSGFSLIVQTLLKLLPQKFKREFRRRKEAMYP